MHLVKEKNGELVSAKDRYLGVFRGRERLLATVGLQTNATPQRLVRKALKTRYTSRLDSVRHFLISFFCDWVGTSAVP